MSKALTKAQADLDAFKAEIEAWMATQPPADVAAARAAAMLPRVEVASAPVEALENDVDTSWVDMMGQPTTITAPPPPPPLFTDARELVAVEVTAPRERYRDRLRREWRETKAEMA